MSLQISQDRAPVTRIVFREASTEAEFTQIHALNHRIFAEEIHQHPRHADRLLVDRFHAQNRYFIALRGSAVTGMISVHEGPEFSVARRLPDSAILAAMPRPLEVRLLAIEPAERASFILGGLLWQVHALAVDGGFSHLLISGIQERLGMYRKMGFRALGPAVPEGAARFVPMALTVQELLQSNRNRVALHMRRWQRHSALAELISLMPGPVRLHPHVTRAYHAAPVSHRSRQFVARFNAVQCALQGLAGGLDSAIFPGGGTHANDAVAANLRASFGSRPGLVLANGEFGERLIRHAASAGLEFTTLSWSWGEPWRWPEVEAALNAGAAWVWGVHVETSTGVLNAAQRLVAAARRTGTAVAMDCVSSLGALPMPHAEGGPLLLSGVSGKALGSYAGLAFVFCDAAWRAQLRTCSLPASFHVARMMDADGPASTVPSSTLEALAAALDVSFAAGQPEQRFAELMQLGTRMRQELRRAGIVPIAEETDAAPHVTSFVLPPGLVGRARAAGFQIAHESDYLRKRGWGQVATMGHITQDSLQPFFAMLRQLPAGTAS